MSALLGMGQPLLDISSEVPIEMLEKYELQTDNTILAEAKHQPLYDELASQPNVKYIPGGATMNTIRVAQWMLPTPGQTVFEGCIGADANGTKLVEACEKDGVKGLFMIDEEAPTGLCATLIVGIERSLCTSLGASRNYKATHCQTPENWSVLSTAKIIYSAGYFVTASPEAMKLAAQEMAKTGGLYCLNFSAPFLMQVPSLKAIFVELMPLVDFIFCNEMEAKVWAETEGWKTTDVKFIGTRLSLVPSAKGRKRTVVITRGPDDTIVTMNGHCTVHPVVRLPEGKVVDTNAAGDSYAGGFLAGLITGLSIDACCRAGAYAASVIVQRSGCSVPEERPYLALESFS